MTIAIHRIRDGKYAQNNSRRNLAAAAGVAIREYLIDVGPADYAPFEGGKAVGVVEAKRMAVCLRFT